MTPAPSIAQDASAPSDFASAVSWEIVVKQIIPLPNNAPATRREVDVCYVGGEEFMRLAKEAGYFKQHCEANYAQRWGGGRYLLGVRDPNSGKLKEVGRCMLDGNPEGMVGTQSAHAASTLTIPMTGDGSEMPKDLNSFMLWFTKTQVEEGKRQRDQVESQLAEERRQNRALMTSLLANKEKGGMETAVAQLGMMKSIIDLTTGFGPRTPTGAEIGLKILESPAVQELAQETLGLARDLGDKWGAANRLDTEGEIGMEADEMTKSNTRKVTPEQYARKLKALTAGKIPDDVIVLCVKEVTGLANGQEKKTGTRISPSERLKGMYEGLKLITLVTEAAHAVNNFILKGKRTTAQAAEYLLKNVSEKKHIEWLTSQSYEQLMEKMQPWREVKSLRQVASFYAKPEVAKAVREVLAYLKDPGKLKKVTLPADSVPDFTEADFGVDEGEDDGEKLSDKAEGGDGHEHD